MANRWVGLDPTSGPLPAASGRPAARPQTLDGAVIGLVANGLGETETLLREVYAQIGAIASPAGAIPVLKGSVSVPPDRDDWQRLTTEATVAITGFGG
jgi:hypothetical protein